MWASQGCKSHCLDGLTGCQPPLPPVAVPSHLNTAVCFPLCNVECVWVAMLTWRSGERPAAIYSVSQSMLGGFFLAWWFWCFRLQCSPSKSKFVKLMGWWDVEQMPGDRSSFSCLFYQLKIVTGQHRTLLSLGDLSFGLFPSLFRVLSDQATLSKDEIWNGSLARHSHFSSSVSMSSASGIWESFFLQGFVTAELTAVFFRMFFFRTKHSKVHTCRAES